MYRLEYAGGNERGRSHSRTYGLYDVTSILGFDVKMLTLREEGFWSSYVYSLLDHYFHSNSRWSLYHMLSNPSFKLCPSPSCSTLVNNPFHDIQSSPCSNDRLFRPRASFASLVFVFRCYHFVHIHMIPGSPSCKHASIRVSDPETFELNPCLASPF